MELQIHFLILFIICCGDSCYTVPLCYIFVHFFFITAHSTKWMHYTASRSSQTMGGKKVHVRIWDENVIMKSMLFWSGDAH